MTNPVTTDLERIKDILGISDAPLSHHARHNLEGALMDMERTGKADQVCLRTIRRIVLQLLSVEQVLS